MQRNFTDPDSRILLTKDGYIQGYNAQSIPEDEPASNLPETCRLTDEEYAAYQERDEQRRREWAAINAALRDSSMAVTRAMSRWYSKPEERERHTEQVLTRYEGGTFLLNRLGAEAVLDQDLAVVLLHFRRGLIEDYGRGPAALMLIDRALAAYQDFIRVEGWIGNLQRRRSIQREGLLFLPHIGPCSASSAR